MRRLAALVLTAALALGLAACGDDGDGEETGGSTTAVTGASSTPTDDGVSTTEDASTTMAEDGTTTEPDGDLPGERIDIYPYENAHLGVVGVAAGDTLNVRSGPGTGFDVVIELGPLSQEPTATGHNRTLDDDSLWVEVDVDGTVGWVNGAFVAQPGAVVDVTDDIPAAEGDTAVALAEAVAASRASSDEGPRPTVTVVAGPEVSDEGERVTVDVVGLADDALKGERLIVLAVVGPEDGRYTASSVEAIALCARGVTDDLLCT